MNVNSVICPDCGFVTNNIDIQNHYCGDRLIKEFNRLRHVEIKVIELNKKLEELWKTQNLFVMSPEFQEKFNDVFYEVDQLRAIIGMGK